MIKIMIVDDEHIIRMGLKKTIESVSDEYVVVGEASNGYEALEKISMNVPDITIVDIKMPEMNGLELARILKYKYADMYIIMLSGFAEFSYAQQALSIGVFDYILKPTDKKQIEQILTKVRKNIYISYNKGKYNNIFILENDCIRVNQEKAEEYGLKVCGERNCRKMVLMALEYINKNFNVDLSLKRISEVFFTNKTYFSEVFKKETGVAFADYKALVRIEKAKELLSNHVELKIYEVADMVGYNDYKYFSQVFKKYTGCMPKDFRDSRTKSSIST